MMAIHSEITLALYNPIRSQCMLSRRNGAQVIKAPEESGMISLS